MAATLGMSESNGAGQTITEPIVNMNFGSTDAPNLNQFVHPMRHSIPRSFVKYWRVLLVALGGSNLVNDVRIWKSAGAFTNFENIISSGLSTAPDAPEAYVTPTNLSDLPTLTPLPTSEPGFQNIGIGGSLNNTVTVNMPVNGTRTNYFAQQCQIDIGGTSAIGSLSTKTYTIQYDEA